MYTDKEVKEILDRVYSEAYDAGIDDTLEYFEENYELDSDDSFDLMDEYDSYTESSKNVRNQMDKLAHKGLKGKYATSYLNGTSKHSGAINKGKDWLKYAKKGNSAEFEDSPEHGRGSNFWDKDEYIVHNTSKNPGKSSPRGRIKSGYNPEPNEARRLQIAQKVKANKNRREAEQKAKHKPFQNKGNKY